MKTPTMIRIAGVEPESFVDGEGIRYTVFTQGCPHHCKGCHNPATHSYNDGYLISVNEILQSIRANPILSGITISGGEPVVQPNACTLLAKGVHELGKTVWLYTGFTYEELQNYPKTRKLLENVDVLVDGKYVEELRDLTLKFRGSSNQRIIDLKTGEYLYGS